MNNMPHAFAPQTPAPNTPRQHPFSSSVHQKEMMLRSQQSSSADLVIETREGDRVALSSSNYSTMSAYTYTGEGVLQTESGSALVSQNYREIALSSGQSFSFTVEGDLSEEEIADIESLLKGLDKVMTKMRHGDIFGAMDKALKIGSFDSVSSYSADLSYRSSYEMSSSTYAATTETLQEQTEGPPARPPEEDAPNRINFDNFFSRLMEQLEAHENRLVGLAHSPINTLFNHHIEEGQKDGEESSSIIEALKTARDELTALIEELTAAAAAEAEQTGEDVTPEPPAEEE